MRNTTTYSDSSRQTRNTHLWREQVVLPRGRGITAESVASPSPNQGVQATANSVRSVRRASGMEECGNTLGVQAPNEPLERSVVDHSTA